MLINGFDVRIGVRVTPLTTENTPRYKEDAPARINLSDYFYLFGEERDKSRVF